MQRPNYFIAVYAEKAEEEESDYRLSSVFSVTSAVKIIIFLTRRGHRGAE
ncbi:hypothetical protein NIES2100_73910 [Calothrix sp. NIES-2100]|nr:hypothetical protein NIES2100_73910 [Calothrix sp. NIES-2100]